MDVDGGGQADGEPGRGGEERGVQVQTDRVRQHALLIGERFHRPHPRVRLLVQEPARPAGLDDNGVLEDGLRRRRVHRLRPQAARVATTDPVPGPFVPHRTRGQAQRCHQFQAAHGGGAAPG